jgi:hypothetical protein
MDKQLQLVPLDLSSVLECSKTLLLLEGCMGGLDIQGAKQSDFQQGHAAF